MISNSLQARSAILLRFAGARGFTSNFSQSWGRMICGCWDSRVLFVSSFANITTSRSLRSYSLSGVITMANQNKNHHGGTDQNFSLHIHTPTTPLLRCPSPAQLVSMAPHSACQELAGPERVMGQGVRSIFLVERANLKYRASKMIIVY